jgi:hypothetical protein
MQLMLNGVSRTLIPLAVFRAQWQLPDDFNLARFSPKDWTGLGSLEHGGPGLARLRQVLLSAVPTTIALPQLRDQVAALSGLFLSQLQLANTEIGLREMEVDFAAAGFQDVLEATAMHLIQLSHANRHDLLQIQSHFDFEAVYQTWLEAGTRVFEQEHPYAHHGAQFMVRVVHNPYGRIGLEVTTETETVYVADPALACPAAGYMHDLEAEVAAALCAALRPSA